MLTIMIRTFKDRWVSLLIYCGTALLFIWMFAAIYPSLASKGAELMNLVKNFPEAMFKAFGIDMESYATSFDSFVASENFSFMWPIMAILIAVGYGASSISGEIEKGTIEIMLSLPVSRLKIFVGKYLSGLLGIFVFTLCSIPTVYLFAKIYNVNSRFENVMTMAMLGLLFCWAIYAITMLFSAMFSEKGKTYMAVLAIILPMYGLNVIAALKENLNGLKYFSFFYYFNQNDALLRHKISTESVIVFGMTILITTLIAVFWFKRRDATV